MQLVAPALLWLPVGQGVQVLVAPMLYVLGSQSTTPLRSEFGFFPAEAVLQKADPGVENSPATQLSQLFSSDAPLELNFPAKQGKSLWVAAW